MKAKNPLLALAITLAISPMSSFASIEEVDGYLQKGDARSAIIDLKSRLQDNGEDGRARLTLGKVYLNLGLPEAAEKELRWASRLGIADKEWLYPLGQAYLQQKKYNDLLERFKPSPNMEPEILAQTLSLRGMAEMAQDNFPEAKELFEQALDSDPKSAYAALGLARMARNRSDMNTATRYIDQAIGNDPNCLDCRLLQGDIALEVNNFDKARNAYQAAADLSPSSYQAYAGLAYSSWGLNDKGATRSSLESLGKLRPETPAYLHLNALLAHEEGDIPRAEEASATLSKTYPDHQPGLLLNGTLAYEGGRYGEARAALGDFIRRNPTHLEARKMLANTQMQLREYEDAVRTIGPALEIKPGDSQSLVILGNALLAAGRTEDGLKYLQQAQEQTPNSAPLFTEMASGALASGRTDLAISQLRRATELAPDRLPPATLLIMALLDKGEKAEAKQRADALAEQHPDDPVVANTLGVVALSQKDRPAAREYFAKAVSLNPQFREPLFNLIRLDVQDKKLDAAHDRLKTYLEQTPGDLQAATYMAQVLSLMPSREQESVQWIEKVLEQAPNALEAKLMKAGYEQNRRNDAEALRLARELYDAYPKDNRVLRILAESHLNLGAPGAALPRLRTWSEQEPESGDAQRLLALTLERLGQFDESAELLDSLVKSNPGDMISRIAYVRVLRDQQKAAKAIGQAQQLQKQFAKHPSGYALEAAIREQQGQVQKALQLYQTAHKIQPQGNTALRIHYLLKATQGFSASMPPLLDWVQSNPNDLTIRRAVGVAYHAAGQLPKATEYYEAVLKDAPEDVTTLNNLALAYADLQDKRALDVAKKAYRVSRGESNIADTYGWVLALDGQLETAESTLRDALSRAPDLHAARYHLAVVLSKQGQRLKARKELERLIEEAPEFNEIQEAKALLDELIYRPQN